MSTNATADAGGHSFTLERRVALVVITIPFLAFIFSVFYFWNRGLSPLDFSLMVIMYFFSGMGVTVGFHRLFTHNSFKANPVLSALLGIGGSMAVQGPLILWVSAHRRHHQKSDQEGDPHSPLLSGDGVWGALKGLWHSHVGWMIKFDLDNWVRYAPDLMRNKLTLWIHKTYFVWVLLGIAIPAAIGGLVTQSWAGAGTAALWAGLVRIFLLHHITWSVNSICHYYGTKPYTTKDNSRNNFVVAMLSFGEGWHNNHHAFPTSARHGLRWWEFDISYIFIKFTKLVGMSSDIVVPKREVIEGKAYASSESEDVTEQENVVPKRAA